MDKRSLLPDRGSEMPRHHVSETAGPESRASPIAAVARSKLRPAATSALVARAAGRCQFRGCNEFLFTHQLTGDTGNFSEQAHIVAFSESGPRGHIDRPVDIHDVDNLMLLCRRDHKLVDDNPGRYSRAELEQHKREHEARVRRVTGFGPSMQTTVLSLTAKIGNYAPVIGRTEIADALLPRYPAEDSCNLDLNGIGNEEPGAFYELAARRIRQEAEKLHVRGGPIEKTQHLSVFGFAPIPLLMVLGHALSNKVATDFFQCHRDKQRRWTWYEAESPVAYDVRQLSYGTEKHSAALVLSLSGPNDLSALPPGIADRMAVHEITIAAEVPHPAFLRQREDLEAFRHRYRLLLARLRKESPGLRELHVFPAVPAPIAVACGFDLLPKVDPTLVVYDNLMKHGGFVERLRINDHERKQIPVRPPRLPATG